MDAEVHRIYRNAELTKPLYNLAVDPLHPDKPNWIIRWMLWHIFRYRDGRQSTKNRRSPSIDSPEADDNEVSSTSTSALELNISITTTQAMSAFPSR